MSPRVMGEGPLTCCICGKEKSTWYENGVCSDGCAKERARRKTAEWMGPNRERHRAKMRAYSKIPENRERRVALARQKREEDPEHAEEMKAYWKKKSADKAAEKFEKKIAETGGNPLLRYNPPAPCVDGKDHKFELVGHMDMTIGRALALASVAVRRAKLKPMGDVDISECGACGMCVVEDLGRKRSPKRLYLSRDEIYEKTPTPAHPRPRRPRSEPDPLEAPRPAGESGTPAADPPSAS